MDFSEKLRAEASSGHARFHEYALTVDKAPIDSFFFFFEGSDDPAFYIGFMFDRLADRPYFEFICDGRDQVIKVHELVSRDGRATGKALFFIDKDHTDIQQENSELPESIFQTSTYSFENYLVCESVLRRYWVERLRLNISDERYPYWLNKFRSCHLQFLRHSRLLMGAILIGRGIDDEPPVKLNLNNVNLERIYFVRSNEGRVGWRDGAANAYLLSINLMKEVVSPRLKRICKKYLNGNPKAYVRGKFEIWFFVKFLQQMTQSLSDKAICRAGNFSRAKPIDNLSGENYLSVIGSLTPCPHELRIFLDRSIPEIRKREIS